MLTREDQERMALKLLSEYQYCVLSTVNSDGHPQGALVQYLTRDFHIIINTFHFSRKVHNIEKEPHVSLVAGLGEYKRTIQYEGVARLLRGEERDAAMRDYHELYPQGWSGDMDTIVDWIYIQPKWLRYVDLSTGDLNEFVLDFEYHEG